MKRKGWVTRDKLPATCNSDYWVWDHHPRYWDRDDYHEWISARSETSYIGGHCITERTAIRLMGCRLKGGPKSIRRVKR